MSDPSAELQNPSTPPGRLAEIARDHPELGAQIAAHPNVYPELQAWIEQYATPQAPAAPQDSPSAASGPSAPETPAAESSASETAAPQASTPDSATAPASEATQPTSSDSAQPGPASAEPATAPGAPSAPAAPTTPLQPLQQTDAPAPAPGAPAPGAPAPAPGAPAPEDPAFGAPTPGAPFDPAVTQATVPLAGAPGAPQQYGAPGQPGGPGFPPQGPGGFQPGPGDGGKKKRTGLFIGIAAALVLLLAVGGGLWWWFSSKVGGSATSEASVEKLVKSVSDIDPLAMYGSLSPAEFSSFQPAIDKALELQADDDSKTGEEFINDLQREVKTDITTPLEIESDSIVTDEVERVTITDGVVEIDGDPEKVADVVMSFVSPVMESQAESYGYDMSQSELDDARDELVDELTDNLPYEIDFSESEVTFVSTHEEGGWYVSPLLTIADYAYQSGGGGSGKLGNEIVAPAEDGAASPEEAASNLTAAIAEGDMDAVVEQMPLAERRFVSIYGDALFGEDFSSMAGFGSGYYDEDPMENITVEVPEAEFNAETDGSSARVTIESLIIEVTQPDWWYEDEDVTTRLTVEGVCGTFESESLQEIDYWDDDALWDEYFDDSNYYDYDSYYDFLEAQGYDLYERTTEEERGCLSDIEALKRLGVEEWALIAVQEDGDWKISPIGTFADISMIVSTKMQEVIEDGELDSLFEDAYRI